MTQNVDTPDAGPEQSIIVVLEVSNFELRTTHTGEFNLGRNYDRTLAPIKLPPRANGSAVPDVCFS